MRTWYFYEDPKRGDRWWSDWPPCYQSPRYRFVTHCQCETKPTDLSGQQ